MLKFVRSASKSKVGTIILALFLAAIVASFALADVSGVLSGGGGASSGELARVGSQRITENDMNQAMQRRLAEVRQENPQASYADIAGEFDAILAALIDERSLSAFADAHGFDLSKRLVDAEIANIPAARDLSGRFSEQAYRNFLAQQRLSDSDIRNMISSSMLQRLLLVPVAANPRAPIGMARPYASMLLEVRSGSVAFLPLAAFRSGLNPSDAQIETFYRQNQSRYMVPEQRVLRIARIGPEQAAVTPPTDEQIAAEYRRNAAQYAAREIRSLSQAVVADQATAQQIAQRARSGQQFAAAAAPAGLSAQDVAVGPQTRDQFNGLAGEDVARAVFAASSGAIVGPIRSDLGWHVVKVDSIRSEGGRPLSAVRGEIAKRLVEARSKDALADLVNRVEDSLADGASFAEAARGANLPVLQTPVIKADGTSLEQPGFSFPQDLEPALAAGFELGEGDDPVVEALAGDSGYVLVSAERILPSSPAPLAQIRDKVRSDWIAAQAANRARAAAKAIAAQAAKAPLAEAAKASPVAIPAVDSVRMQRIQLSQFQGRVPPAVGALFSLAKGKATSIAGAEGEGFYVVKVEEIVPGNALSQPSLISEAQQQIREALSQEYAAQFLQSIKSELKISTNDSAIAAAKQRFAATN